MTDRPDNETPARGEPAPNTAFADENVQSPFPDLPSVRAALEAGQIGIWSWDVSTDTVRWSGNLEGIHDVPRGSFDGSFASFQQDIHPEDQARY
jgi:PAS domain-containing protein